MVAVGGETLADRLGSTGMLAPQQAAALLGQVAHELAATHAAGKVHGNISPSTVLIGPDGTARLAHDESAGDLDPGSIPYLAPEAVDGGPATRAGDLWALGATLYAAVEGAPPFPGDTTDEILQGIRRDPIPPSLRGRGVSWVIALLLSREPVGRLSAQEVAEALGAMGVPAPDPEPVVVPGPVIDVATRPVVRTPRSAPVHAREPVSAGAVPVEQSSTGWLLLLAASVVAITLMLLLS